uniref:RGG repeats nuclear RNA binding protein A n=1 Tax=Apopellia endiviifolia (species B) TaxID=119729 RepID=A0A6B7NW78_9MARC|nr:RGG repeats nuclear RNA binding protein A [Apopellia endiviifolia (species B)]
MSSQNYFDLLGDDENEEPTAVIARATLPHHVETPTTKKLQAAAAAAAPPRLPNKLSITFEAAKEPKYFEGGRGVRASGRGGRNVRGSYGDREREGGSRDTGSQRENREVFTRERGGFNGDRSSSANRENNSDGYQRHRGGGPGGIPDGTLIAGSGGYGGGYGGERFPRVDGENWASDGGRGRGRVGAVTRSKDRGFVVDVEERPRRREFDRRSGSGFGNEIKRDGSGRGNWGAEGDQGPRQEIAEVTPKVELAKVVVDGEDKVEIENNIEGVVPAEDGVERKEDEEDNELTLDEYEKILEEKRRALLASKAEERKVQVDKSFESMQLVDKKNEEDVFIKLGSDKEKKKKEKEALDKEDKIKKTQSINEFLKPVDGEKYYGSSVGRGRGRGRGRAGEGRSGDSERGVGFGGRGNFTGGLNNARRVSAPRIEDPGQFPTLGAK